MRENIIIIKDENEAVDLIIVGDIERPEVTSIIAEMDEDEAGEIGQVEYIKNHLPKNVKVFTKFDVVYY